MFKNNRTLTIESVLATNGQKAGICPICKQYYPQLTEHHVKKKMIWGRGKHNRKYIVYICDYCHLEIESEITRRENIVLMERFETIYEDVILSFIEGSIEVQHPKRGKYHR